MEEYNDSMNIYIEKEIQPAMHLLKSYGFFPTSFAYPFGKGTEVSDSVLLSAFKVVRKATYDYKNTGLDQYDEIYYKEGNGIINSMGIDVNYHTSLEKIKKGFKRAEEENETIVFHTHNINKSGGDYTITPESLESIFKLASEYALQSVTFQQKSKLE